MEKPYEEIKMELPYTEISPDGRYEATIKVNKEKIKKIPHSIYYFSVRDLKTSHQHIIYDFFIGDIIGKRKTKRVEIFPSFHLSKFPPFRNPRIEFLEDKIKGHLTPPSRIIMTREIDIPFK